jgi:hypothetical protein
MGRRGYYPRGRPGVLDLAKGQWNREVEALVRRVQTVTWEDLRNGWRFIERMVQRGRRGGEGG